MRVPDNLHRGQVGFNMTPMIDVVFLLIIFFLVSSHLAKQEAQLELPLPVADSGSEARLDNAPQVIVNVLGDGNLILAGRKVLPQQLQTRLKQRLETEGQNLEVKIRSDRNVAYRHVEPIMLACWRSGIWNVTYSVYRSKDVR